jgi:hypothetical protein
MDDASCAFGVQLLSLRGHHPRSFGIGRSTGKKAGRRSEASAGPAPDLSTARGAD